MEVLKETSRKNRNEVRIQNNPQERTDIFIKIRIVMNGRTYPVR